MNFTEIKDMEMKDVLIEFNKRRGGLLALLKDSWAGQHLPWQSRDTGRRCTG